MNSVLILNHEPITVEMAGPTIRNWELSRLLARHFDVTLAAPGPAGPQSSEFKVVTWNDQPPTDLVASADVVKVSGFVLHQHPHVAEAHHLVVDLYDPFPLENLHMYDERPVEERHRIANFDREVQSGLIRAGDVFLCASERQRDFWLGWMAAVGRINPFVHEVDPGFKNCLLVVPFGISDEPPKRLTPRFRGAMAGIAKSDLVVIWGGGIWNWLDPLTLIQAAALTRDRLPHLRVVFPVISVPSPDVLPMKMLASARALADKLDLTGERVFFGSKWIPHNEFGGVLLEADIGISLHQESVETRFSFRTRILDYLWAGLPIIATEGDSMADLVRAEELGAVVPPQDVDRVASALIRLGSDSDRRAACARRSREVAERFRWSGVGLPLVEYCTAPYQAPDRKFLPGRKGSKQNDGAMAHNESRRLVKRAVELLASEGPRSMVAKSASYLRRLSRRDRRPR